MPPRPGCRSRRRRRNFDMLARVYLPTAAAECRFTLNAAQSRHLIKVLRLRNGAECAVFDGKGACYRARIVHEDKDAAVLHTGAALPPSPADAGRTIHIGQVVCTTAKMDWAVEKMTELGATTLTLLSSENSRVPAGERQMQRWQRLMVAACAQCGRNTVPALLLPQPAAQWQPPAQRIVLTPCAAHPLAEVAAKEEATAIALAVGGESGFSVREEEALLAGGFQAAHLGARILRSETAALTALALLQLGKKGW